MSIKFNLPFLMFFYVITTDTLNRHDEILGIDTFYLVTFIIFLAPIHTYYLIKNLKT